MSRRQDNFDRAIEEYDEKALTKSVDFEQHRFVSIERDVVTGDRFVRGHKSLRGACSQLSRAVAEGEPYVPEFVLDLDRDEKYELDLFAFVSPRAVDGVALLLPRFLALRLRNLVADDDTELRPLIDQALQRRH